MEESEILARLRALLGSSAGYEIDANAPTPEERKRIQASMDEAAADAAEAEIEMESLLPTGSAAWTDSYPRARAKYLARRALADGLSARTMRRRVRVGRRTKAGFRPVVQGDDWDEVFAKLQRKSAA